MTAGGDDPRLRSGTLAELDSGLALGVDPEGDMAAGRRAGRSHVRRKRATYYIVFEKPDKPPLTADLDAMRELAALMLRLRVRVSSCGCNGGTWFSTRRGRCYDRWALVDEAPADPRLQWIAVEAPTR